MEYMYLQGSEEVGRAASSMHRAAEMMGKVEGNFEQAMFQLEQNMEQWIARIEAVAERMSNENPKQ